MPKMVSLIDIYEDDLGSLYEAGWKPSPADAKGLVSDTSAGLAYLHSRAMVYGSWEISGAPAWQLRAGSHESVLKGRLFIGRQRWRWGPPSAARPLQPLSFHELGQTHKLKKSPT